jgi:hypothetical protein
MCRYYIGIEILVRQITLYTIVSIRNINLCVSIPDCQYKQIESRSEGHHV